MAEVTTLARPYAEAAFAFASESNNVQGWSDALSALAEVASLEEMKAVIASPRADRNVIAGILADAIKTTDAGLKNLLGMMAENNRLSLLGAVSALFEEQKAQANQTLIATVTAAYALTEEQKASIIAALEKRMGGKVELTENTDSNMVAGVKITVGDYVIDGSFNAQLAKLSAALT
jgi:F-type H+-transporting ATPase subunit delta